MLSVKQLLTKILGWIFKPFLNNDGTYDGGNTYYRAKRTDTNTQVSFGIGAGGINHGVYSNKLGKWLIYGDASSVYVNGIDMTKTSPVTSTAWVNNTAGTVIYWRCGDLVTVTIQNPTKLAAGNNSVFQLPTGFRPPATIIVPLPIPVASTSTNVVGLSLRATIKTNGYIDIYNYKGSAVTSTTNASATVTFIAA